VGASAAADGAPGALFTAAGFRMLEPLGEPGPVRRWEHALPDVDDAG
jgi:hypothetical protein